MSPFCHHQSLFFVYIDRGVLKYHLDKTEKSQLIHSLSHIQVLLLPISTQSKQLNGTEIVLLCHRRRRQRDAKINKELLFS